MPLSGTSMGADIKTAIIAYAGPTPPLIPSDDVLLTNFCNALGTAIVNNIKANAVVNSTGADPQGGVVVSVGTIT